jgi:hypothetical protein
MNQHLILYEIGEDCDTCALLSKAYGGEAMKKSSVFVWPKQFKEGQRGR